ncbi:MAG: carbohydrate binding domain-containing protein, partial [Eubacterium sp.]|nr:carbohydrate binding domain-containing protein [Eubacterium sp.]
TVTDKNLKTLPKLLKSAKVKTINLNLVKTKELTIESGDFSDKDIVVNSKNTVITNLASFDDVVINNNSQGQWREKGRGNCIQSASDEPVNMVIETRRKVASITVSDSASAKNNIDIKSGAVGSVLIENKAPVYVKTSASASIGTVTVANAGATVDVETNGMSRVNNIEIGGSAGGADTRVNVNARGTSVIGKIINEAKGANVWVNSSNDAHVKTVQIIGDASALISGTSNKKTTVDVTRATADARVKVDAPNAAIELGKGQSMSGIVENRSGSVLESKVVGDDTGSSSGASTPSGSSGSSGGSSSVSSSSYKIETEEGNLIRNGKFPNPGAWTDDYKTYVADGNSYTIGNGEAKFVLRKVGQNAWDNMLAQHRIKVEKDAKYVLKFTASSTAARKISVALANDNGAKWYGGGDAELTSAEQEFTYDIDMSKSGSNENNSDGYLKFSMGMFTVYNENGAAKHPEYSAASTIVIKNVSLKKVESSAPSTGADESKDDSPKDDETTSLEIIKPVSDQEIVIGEVSEGDKIVYYAEAKDYDLPMTDAMLSLIKNKDAIKGKALQVTMTVKKVLDGSGTEVSDVSKLKSFIWTMDEDWSSSWIQSNEKAVEIKSQVLHKINLQDYNTKANDLAYHFRVRVTGEDVSTSGWKILFDINKIEIIDDAAAVGNDEGGTSTETEEGNGKNEDDNSEPKSSEDNIVNLLDQATEASYGGNVNKSNNKWLFTLNGNEADYSVAFQYTGVSVEEIKKYKLSMKVKSSIARNIKICIQNSSYKWYCGSDVELSGNEEKEVTFWFLVNGEDGMTADDALTLQANLGTSEKSLSAHTIEFYDVVLEEVQD